jgi:hypothetical protein
MVRNENPPLGMVTEAGLASAPVDYLDPLLLAQLTPQRQSVNPELSATALADASEPRHQVGNVMLHGRLATLVDEGKPVADGDPWDYSTRVRLPG